MARKSDKARPADPATVAYELGTKIALDHPAVRALLVRISVVRDGASRCPADGFAVAFQSGEIHVHRTRRLEPREWAYVLSRAALHFAFDHFKSEREDSIAWEAACNVVIDRFLRDLKIGQDPFPSADLPGGNEDRLYRAYRESGVPPSIRARFSAGERSPGLVRNGVRRGYQAAIDFPKVFAASLVHAVTEAVDKVAGHQETVRLTRAERARRWMIASFPLLGAMAAAFKIVERTDVCSTLGVAIGAVSAHSATIYINPAAALSENELRFVMAHEILHVALRHHARIEGRDAFLWNVACDFVINGWLLEMGLGQIPEFGGLHDDRFKGLSAEAVYDIVVQNLRLYRKCTTFAGIATSDILDRSAEDRPEIDLDDFCRRALAQGLALHRSMGRGTIPAGLVQEIEALSAPAIPWDVKLAQWLDGFFGPLEPRRTYARASRRQAATPDIPRPRTIMDPIEIQARTFAVVLDTSGSMQIKVLARALGSIASYAASRDVPMVRLVFCDAVAYDEGYVPAEQIADRVRIRGRGGTVLQPGIDLVESATDFPKDGPILVITDGYCDRISVHRDHAFLMPVDRGLPFVPKGRLFLMTE